MQLNKGIRFSLRSRKAVVSFRHMDGSGRARILLLIMGWGILELFTVGAAAAYSAESPASTCKPSDPVERICSDITSGNFAGAKKTLSDHCSDQDSLLDALSKILCEYEQVEQRRKHVCPEIRRAPLSSFGQNNGLESLGAPIRDTAVFGNAWNLQHNADSSAAAETVAAAFGKWQVPETLYGNNLLDSIGNCGESRHCRYRTLQEIDTAEALFNAPGHIQTPTDRYRISPGIFDWSVRTLSLKFIRLLDYKEMASAMLCRGRILAELLSNSEKKWSFSFRADKLAGWSAGVQGTQSELEACGPEISQDEFLRTFDRLIALNSATLGLPLPTLIPQLTDAAFGTLDRYTDVIWPWQVDRFAKDISLEFSGIGVVFSKEEGGLKVLEIMPGSPASASGLCPNDIITEVQGRSVNQMTLHAAVNEIMGPANTMVTLTAIHADSNRAERISIKRGRVVIPTVLGWRRETAEKWNYIIDPANRIGYVRLTNFAKNTVDDFKKVLNDLEGDGLNGLIMDLRGNTGGYLAAAVEIADMFVENGMIVISQPRCGQATYYTAGPDQKQRDYPIIVLVDDSSASASEVLAGALQDSRHSRALVVGQRTFGKGCIQEIAPIPASGSQLKYTVAQYRLPSGKRVKNHPENCAEQTEDWGLQPDVEVAPCCHEPENTRRLRQQNQAAPVDNTNNPHLRSAPGANETINGDPCLAIGVLVLKAKLVQQGYVPAI